MIILAMSIPDQGRAAPVLPPPLDPIPEGCEPLLDVFGDALTDIQGQRIYVLIRPYVPVPDSYELLTDAVGQALKDQANENIYVLKHH